VIDVSIVIVSFNARADLERCLESLQAHPPAASHEIIVVDNQSSDDSAATAGRRPGVRVIEAGGNFGFARATNIGIRASCGANLLLLNSDTIVPASAIDRLLDELRRDPGAAVVGPRLVDANGRAELSYGRMIGPFNELRQKIRTRRPALVDRLTRRRHSPDWVSGACLLVRRADAEAVGLLDERFFMYTEDVDFCAAIKARGRRAGGDPGGVPPQPDRVLRKASPGMGAAVEAVSRTARAGLKARMRSADSSTSALRLPTQDFNGRVARLACVQLEMSRVRPSCARARLDVPLWTRAGCGRSRRVVSPLW